jgi:DNA-binding NarL/FixJ family response regulator
MAMSQTCEDDRTTPRYSSPTGVASGRGVPRGRPRAGDQAARLLGGVVHGVVQPVDLSKGAGPAELTAGILQVARGHNALSQTAVSALVAHVADRGGEVADPAAASLVALFTLREREIVEAIVRGLDNAQIAQQQYLSPFTVKTHANRAVAKVGARDRARLVSLAVQAGIRP